MLEHRHIAVITDESPHPSPSLVLCLVCQETISGECAVSNDDLQNAVDIGILCDEVRWTCLWCKKIDMHGMAVHEKLHEFGPEIMTGVICQECQRKPINLKSF